jgi:hypothetical protein
MFGSSVLNVIIGLLFIYLLYSLLATIIQEFIAVWIGLRSSILRKGIVRMLDDEGKGEAVTQAFYNHPLIKYLGERNHKSIPSYLNARNFSKVMIDLLRGQQTDPGKNYTDTIQQALDKGIVKWGDVPVAEDTLKYLRSIWVDARGDLDTFRKLLEQWFDDTMERATDWYKKRIQYILFLIGLTIAILFNVETISIVKKLSRNPDLAEKLANNASVYLQNQEAVKKLLVPSTADTAESLNSSEKDTLMMMIDRSNHLLQSADALVNNEIRDSGMLLGLGWTNAEGSARGKICIPCNFHWYSIIGWLITALAISLGAPFWFDLLNKLMKLRTSVAAGTTDDKRQKSESTGETVQNPGTGLS